MLGTIFNLKIFEGIEKNVVEEIILNSPEKSFKSGEIILSEGAESNGEGYIINKGSVKVSIAGKQIAELYEGEIIGEIALLNEEQRTATVEATSDTELIVLNLENLINMINNGDNKINKFIVERMEENLERK